MWCVALLLRIVTVRIETISWSPRAFVFHNFLSEEEVQHMLGIVEKQVGNQRVTCGDK